MVLRVKSRKGILVLGLAVLVAGFLMPRSANATAIDFTSISFHDQIGLGSGSTNFPITCSPVCNSNVSPAVPPYGSSVSNKVTASGTGLFLGDSLTYSGLAHSSFFNSATNPFFSANSVGMLTFNSGTSHNFQFNQDSGWTGFFTASQTSYSLPLFYHVTKAGTGSAGFNSTFKLVLYNYTAGGTTLLLGKSISSGTSYTLKTDLSLSSLVLGDTYEIYLTTNLEQLDQVYATGGSMYTNSSLIVGSPEPSSWILFGTGAALMLGFLL